MRTLFFTFCFFTVFFSWSQKNVFLNLTPKFGNQPFALNQTFIGNDGIAVAIEHFNYYITDVKLFHDNGQQTHLPTDIWLVTPSQNSLYLGYLSVQQIDSIKFTVGVPKRYNVQGGALAQDISTYPETHALSFQTPSMYWGWSFGYMHMIVGGKADSNNDGVPNAYFELHNFGNSNQQDISLPAVQTTNGNQIDLHYNCRIDRWLNQMPLSSVGILHGESGLNLSILQNVNTQDVFILDQAANLVENDGNLVYWKQTNTEITIQTVQNQIINTFQVFSNTGQKVIEANVNSPSTSIQLEQLKVGLYLINVEMNNGKRQVFRIVKS
jgi:hypothetical protein